MIVPVEVNVDGLAALRESLEQVEACTESLRKAIRKVEESAANVFVKVSQSEEAPSD